MDSVRTWTADDAVRVAAGFTRWLGTADAVRFHRRPFAECSRVPEQDCSQAAQVTVELLASSLRDEPVIWCDPAMVDMLAASAASLPAAAVDEPLLLPQTGLLVFAKHLPADWIATVPGTGELTRHQATYRAISWTQFAEDGTILVTPWGAGVPTTLRWPDGLRTRTCDLQPRGIVQFYNHARAAAPQDSDLMRLLRALGELSRHPITRQDDTPTSKASRRAAKAAGTSDAGIRRLYLQRPESGPAELAALRAERIGSVRAHWVRGHWKRQWLPSIQEHRWTFIEGYARGEGPLPDRGRPAALVARGNIAS